jgi:hypothetical protein
MAEYEVKQGDWFARIVRRKGYGAAWKPIFNHGDNEDFREKCPDPDLLIPGEMGVLPDKEMKEDNKATSQKWTFEKAPDKAQFHVVILRADGQPVKNTAFKIVFHGPNIEGRTLTRQTDGSGAIKCEITTDAESATLTIEGQTFELMIGHLEPSTTTKGVQARLQNLNYHIEAIDGAAGAGSLAEAAIKAFQKNYTLADTAGVVGNATKSKLKDVYGC